MDTDYAAGYLAGYEGWENLAYSSDSAYAIGWRDGFHDQATGRRNVFAAMVTA